MSHEANWIINDMKVELFALEVKKLRKLYLNKVLGFIEPPKEITVIGSLRHNIYDRVNKIEKEIILSIKDKFVL